MAVVIPAFNEADNLAPLASAIENALASVSAYILFVDDGSSDGTREVLAELAEANPNVGYISFSRNFGHQVALRAGLEHVDADCVVTMDADFQHPPDFIPTMIAYWESGADIVVTLRDDDASLSVLKRLTSSLYYRVFNYLSDVPLTKGAADFRLLDRTAHRALLRFGEADQFYRGLIPRLGFKTIAVNYPLASRRHGTSKYSLIRMLRLGLKGVISSSIRPLRLASALSFIVLGGALFYTIFVILSYIFFSQPVSGWTSIILLILGIGGANLMVMGIVGEYIGQILTEVRKRPPYLTEKIHLAPGWASRPETRG